MCCQVDAIQKLYQFPNKLFSVSCLYGAFCLFHFVSYSLSLIWTLADWKTAYASKWLGFNCHRSHYYAVKPGNWFHNYFISMDHKHVLKSSLSDLHTHLLVRVGYGHEEKKNAWREITALNKWDFSYIIWIFAVIAFCMILLWEKEYWHRHVCCFPRWLFVHSGTEVFFSFYQTLPSLWMTFLFVKCDSVEGFSLARESGSPVLSLLPTCVETCEHSATLPMVHPRSFQTLTPRPGSTYG